MSKLKYRVWSDELQEMRYLTGYEKNFGDIVMGRGVLFNRVMLYTGLQDQDGIDCWEGDLRFYRGKYYKVVFDGLRFRFERNLVQFGDNDSFIIGVSVIFESKFVGNVYQHLNLIKQRGEI